MAGKLPPEQFKKLLIAGALEAVCIGGGVLAYLTTDKIIWLVIGVVAGTGFSLPAIIELIRAGKGQD